MTRIPSRPGTLLITLAVAGLAVHLWLAAGVFLSLSEPAGLEFVFVSAGFGAFARALAMAAAGVLGLHGLARAIEGRRGTAAAAGSLDDARYLTPVLLSWLSVLPVLSVLLGVAQFSTVAIYWIVDLRWWWSAVVLAWVLARLSARLWPNPGWAEAWVSWARARSPRTAGAVLVGLGVVWVVAGTPNLRFSGALHGDEPKYVRYCENFYQGLGFELTDIRPLTKLPPDFSSRVWHNVTLLASTLPGELASLASDAAMFARHPEHTFNRATYLGAWFIRGKNGGVYQVHTPGLSFLMFPAYYVDRTFESGTPGYQDEFPANLPAINTFFLAMYAAWVALAFRFLRRAVSDPAAAWLAAAVVALTFPGESYAFQFYPEVACGILALLLAHHVWFGGRRTWPRAFVYGLVAGFLLWLHVRFGLAAFWLVGWAVVAWRHDRARVGALAAGFAVSLGSFSLYAYQLTGSVLPTAMYDAGGAQTPLSLPAVGRGLVAILLDRNWGLLGPSPIYLLALPGLWLLWRRRRGLLLFSAGLVLALVGPAAGHGITAGGGTPLRYLVAALPFVALALAELLSVRCRTRLCRSAFGVLLFLSLQNAWAYNRHLYKEVALMNDWSASGWKTTLLMPRFMGAPWTGTWANVAITFLWLALLAALVVGPAWADRRVRADGGWVGRLNRLAVPRLVAAMVALMVLAGTGVAAATGFWSAEPYRMPQADAAVRAAFFIDNLGHCVVCATSSAGQVGTAGMMKTLEDASPAVAGRRALLHLPPTYDEWLAMPDKIRQWYIDANGYPPADADLGHYLYQWREEHVAAEEIRRRIYQAAGKTPPAEPAKQ